MGQDQPGPDAIDEASWPQARPAHVRGAGSGCRRARRNRRLGLFRRGRVRQVLAQGVREDGRDLFGRPAAGLGDGAHGRRVVEERHHARHHEEELPVDVLRGVGRQVDDPGRHVLGAEVAEREAALPGAAREAALGAHRARRLGDGRGHAGHRAGADGVHRDAVAADVARGDAREPRDAVLGRAVVRLPRVAVDARGGRDRDDPPAPLLAHAAGGVPGAVEGALQVDGDDRVPLLLAHVEDHAVAQDAGAGDERIEAAPGLERRADDARGAVPGGDRLGVGDGLAAGAADLLDHVEGGAARRRAAVERDAVVVHDHPRALGGEPDGDAPSDAAARAGHDRDAAGEHVCHECDLPRSPISEVRMLHRPRGSGRGARSSGSLPPPMLLSEHDRPTALHYRILALTWAGWLFDFYDLILYTFLLAPISRELGLGREAHAVLLGASLGATALGGALFGYLADRHGRRAVLQWSILTYSAGTVLCGLAPGIATLLAARLVTGLGVGGEAAIGHALLGESVPARLRGRFGALLQTGAPVAVGLAALVGSFVAPAIGWRATFIFSGLPAL